MSEVTDAKSGQQPTAEEVNMFAAKALAGHVRTTLGPMGRDKMMVDGAGEVVVTNDGATILREMNITHPTAKMIVDVARTQEENCYDGTTSSIILTGEMMKQAESLLSKNIHPTKIANGYLLAAEKCEQLLEEIVIEADEELLKSVAKTAMTGKSADNDKDTLANICVEVATAAKIEDISIVRRSGAKVSESVAIAGLLVDRERCHHNMPDAVEDAKIALIDVEITLPEFAKALQVQVSDNDAVKEFIASRKEQLQALAQSIMDTGANVVLCLKDIDKMAQEYFAKHGIYAARRVARSDLEAVSEGTGARIVSAIDEISSTDLGKCGLVEEITVGDHPLIKLTKTPSDSAVSVLIRAPTKHVVAEIKRAFDDAVGVVSLAYETKKLLAGGGSSFMYLSCKLREYAPTVGGREQLAVEAFANTLEIIPSTLAENSGNDPLDCTLALRQAHTAGDIYAGVNVETGGILDMKEAGVTEPLVVVAQEIQSAASLAHQLLRIDEIISAKPKLEIGDDGFDF